MKRFISRNFLMLAFTALLISCSQSEENKIPVISVTGGRIMGVLTDSTQVVSYKGIPYAAPPIGDLRWRRPQPVIPWDTVMLADHFGPIAIQYDFKPEETWFQEFYWMGKPAKSEDCLYLNVWTPAKAIGDTLAKLPVAVFIHGGAFTQGYSNEIPMDGDSWAKRGVILVSLNYRVGTYGFLCHPELAAENPDGHSGNYGLYDQLAALKWVKQNIAQFGGNPDNIMLFGESAGAMSTMYLVASPLAKDLMQKAFIESGGGVGSLTPTGRSEEESAAYGKEVMDHSGLTSLEKMRAATVEEILTAEEKYKKDMGIEWLDMRPVVDSTLICETFGNALMNRRVADIPYINSRTGDDMAAASIEALREFCEVRDSLSNQPVYMLSFERKLPGQREYSFHDLAFHDCDIWYTFGTLNRSWRPFTQHDYDLSNQLIDYLTNFAKTGDPNQPAKVEPWSAYTREKPEIKVMK